MHFNTLCDRLLSSNVVHSRAHTIIWTQHHNIVSQHFSLYDIGWIVLVHVHCTDSMRQLQPCNMVCWMAHDLFIVASTDKSLVFAMHWAVCWYLSLVGLCKRLTNAFTHVGNPSDLWWNVVVHISRVCWNAENADVWSESSQLETGLRYILSHRDMTVSCCVFTHYL